MIVQIALLVLAVGAYLYFAAQYYAVDCSKNEIETITCTLRTTILGAVTVQKDTLNDVAAAAVKDDCAGGLCAYRIEMKDYDGLLHTTTAHYPADPLVKQKLAGVIDNFINDPQSKEITLRETINWNVIILPIVAVLAFIGYRWLVGRPK